MRWRAALLLLAVAAAFLPIPASVVESLYSVRFFPIYQIVATSLSNRVSFAVFDVLVFSAAAYWLFQTTRDLVVASRTGWVRALLRVGLRTLTIAAAAYVVFLLTWGLNYRRVRLEDKLRFDRSRISADAATALAERSVAQMNALYEPAHRMGWVPPDVIDRPLGGCIRLWQA